MQKVFRAHAVFIMPEYQCVLLDRRSLEGKKKGKKRTDLSSKHIWLTVWEKQTL